MSINPYAYEHRIDHRPYSDRTDRGTWGDLAALIAVLCLLGLAVWCMQGCAVPQAKTSTTPASTKLETTTTRTSVNFEPEAKPALSPQVVNQPVGIRITIVEGPPHVASPTHSPFAPAPTPDGISGKPGE